MLLNESNTKDKGKKIILEYQTRQSDPCFAILNSLPDRKFLENITKRHRKQEDMLNHDQN